MYPLVVLIYCSDLHFQILARTFLCDAVNRQTKSKMKYCHILVSNECDLYFEYFRVMGMEISINSPMVVVVVIHTITQLTMSTTVRFYKLFIHIYHILDV